MAGKIKNVYILGVSEDKPKPVQAQAIKARTAKFKLRHAGQARFASPSDKSGFHWYKFGLASERWSGPGMELFVRHYRIAAPDVPLDLGVNCLEAHQLKEQGAETLQLSVTAPPSNSLSLSQLHKPFTDRKAHRAPQQCIQKIGKLRREIGSP
ncbi:hypothetical protein B0H13DRAFT_1908221 [Mycena leptocephala]|nr:hypothetical protein B0H13DRAFT_1908221 [Mycena leptocephala]